MHRWKTSSSLQCPKSILNRNIIWNTNLCGDALNFQDSFLFFAPQVFINLHWCKMSVSRAPFCIPFGEYSQYPDKFNRGTETKKQRTQQEEKKKHPAFYSRGQRSAGNVLNKCRIKVSILCISFLFFCNTLFRTFPTKMLLSNQCHWTIDRKEKKKHTVFVNRLISLSRYVIALHSYITV